MSAATAAARGRRAAEALMADTITITRPGGERVFDESTGSWTTPAGSTIYSGKAKLRTQGVSVGYDQEVGGGDIRINTVVLSVPAETSVQRDDVVEITASPGDPDLVGRSFRVSDVVRATWRTARKAMLEEVG